MTAPSASSALRIRILVRISIGIRIGIRIPRHVLCPVICHVLRDSRPAHPRGCILDVAAA